jgi:hypothetical protein
MLADESILDTLDCKLWYQGNYDEIVQMFSHHPVVKIPLIKPYLKDASTIGADIKTLKHLRLSGDFSKLRSMVRFLEDRIYPVETQRGITIIKRGAKRIYLETDELVDRLQVLQIPVRVVQLELESFGSQVNIMRNTSILIAPHGAGTMNQVFMPAGGNIIELFPKGYSNWHAKAVADVFGHKLTEIESEVPGVFGREPGTEIRQCIVEGGWPNRRIVQASRKRSQKLLRVVRDVKSYSISPERIVNAVKAALCRTISEGTA